MIIKLTHNNRDYYLEWSTIVDAPVTYGLPLSEFKNYYRGNYGDKGLEDLQKRMDRVEKNGHSSIFNETLDDIISTNRAGHDEKAMTKEELIEAYIINRPGAMRRPLKKRKKI